MSQLGQSRRRTRDDLPQAPQERTPRVQGPSHSGEATCDGVRVWQAAGKSPSWRRWRPANACSLRWHRRPGSQWYDVMTSQASRRRRQRGLDRGRGQAPRTGWRQSLRMEGRRQGLGAARLHPRVGAINAAPALEQGGQSDSALPKDTTHVRRRFSRQWQ
jgi:hypothetical protein